MVRTFAPAKQRKILVSSALPYANGSLHAGHILEHTQTDIWVRFQRLRGHHCTYICADDGHGTTTMLEAKKRGLSPEALLEIVREEHIRDFVRFHIQHDHYHSTHSPENRRLSELVYKKCRAAGRIAEHEVTQLYDTEENMFLADRFVCGTCPKCHTDNQNGDSCERCGATYDATELINPVSILSDSTPVLKKSTHLFFDLPFFEGFLKDWVQNGHVHSSVVSKLNEWLGSGLTQWNISRDAPYFGFEIPDAEGKYFYVWVDAPIGYMASFQYLTKQSNDLDFDDYWDEKKAAEAGTEVHHFIGKDIIYFHALFWPAMLKCAGLRTPTKIHTHGFLTINKNKLSKSRDIDLNVQELLKHCDPEHLRYYFAARLAPGVDDIDINLSDFVQRVNTDLVGKLVNIASRSAHFISQNFNGVLSKSLPDQAAFDELVKAGGKIADAFEATDFARAIRDIMAQADRINEYIQAETPWALIKSEQAEERVKVQSVCTQVLNAFKVLVLYIKPIMPMMAARVENFLGIEPLTWANFSQPLLDHKIQPFETLLTRVDEKAVLTLAQESVQADGQPPAKGAKNYKTKEKPEISYEDFSRIDLKVARIVQAEAVPKANKLLKLTLDIGEGTKQVFAGIKNAYDPKELEDRLTVVVANLTPRKMRFGVSEGMVLVADDGDTGIFLLSPDTGAKPGMIIK